MRLTVEHNMCCKAQSLPGSIKKSAVNPFSREQHLIIYQPVARSQRVAAHRNQLSVLAVGPAQHAFGLPNG